LFPKDKGPEKIDPDSLARLIRWLIFLLTENAPGPGVPSVVKLFVNLIMPSGAGLDVGVCDDESDNMADA